MMFSKETVQLASISYFFIMIGIVMGNWVARIPDVKDAHNLSDGEFGLILICAVGGGLVSFPFVSPIVNTYGSNRGVLFGAVAITILAPIIGIPFGEVWVLCLGLAGLGFGKKRCCCVSFASICNL